jgi:hypothetical protein
MVDEVLEIRPARDGLALVTKSSSHGDYYTAFGRLPLERQLMGHWRSRPGLDDMQGLFTLLISPGANFMYGYFTTPDVTGSTVHGTWVLAKQTGIDEPKVQEALRKAQEMLTTRTLGARSP